MDLTKEYPRSVREKVLGVVQIGRAIDKGKAKAHGNVGEYNYECGMDKAVFEFLGIDGNALLEVIRTAKSDADIEAYLKPFVAKKSATEIESWNASWLEHEPDNEGSQSYFNSLREQVAPDRTDVTAWADLLDLDEKRPVPVRVPA